MTRGWIPQFGRFLSVGVLTTLVSVLLIFSAKYFLGWGDVVANAFGYALGLLLNFQLNSRWTFGYGGPRGVSLVRFLLSALLAWSVNLAAVVVLVRYFHVNGYVAQLAGMPFYTVTAYLLGRTFVFRARPA